ncbi:MAG TPA: hypothetical protein VEO54_03630 [Thermoanaerobaculia bacterium]|nr:hypothetical protein [Thermoanaerobaculia bacterium]
MRTLTALLLLVLTIPAAAAIHVSAESPLSPAQFAPAPAYDAQIATDGETYVALWTDYRTSRPAVYATRFRRDGTLLDRIGVQIAPSGKAGAVIWSGRTFLLTYLQEEVVRVRSLASDGTLGAPVALFDSTVEAESYRMRMATNGDSVLLVTSQAAAALLDLDGTLRRRIAMPWERIRDAIGVAAAGPEYLVAASADLRVKTQLVHANGDLGPQKSLARGTPYGVDVASDGNRFLVTWAIGHLQAVFVARSGEPIEPLLTLTQSATPPHPATRGLIDLVWRGSEYLLVYADFEPYQPYLTLRVAADGTPAGPLFTNDRWSIVSVVPAPDGSIAILGLNDEVLTGAFLDAQGSALRDETRVAIAARSQRDIHLATLPGGLASAWIEWDHEAGKTLQLSRGPGSAPVLVSDEVDVLVDVVAEGTAIWVVWTTEDATLYARRYTSALQPLDAGPVAVGKLDAPGADAAVAAGGGSVIVVSTNLHHGGFEPQAPHIVAHVLRGGAGITATTTEVASEPDLDHDPAVAWNGTSFVVAWANALPYDSSFRSGIGTNDVYTGLFPNDRILTLQLDANGRRHADAPVEIARSKHIETLTMAHGARHTAVAWQPYAAPNLTSRRHTYAALAVPQSAVIDLGGEDMHLASFAAHGNGFLLARAAVNDETRIVEPEVLELDASLRITDRVPLAPFMTEIAFERKSFDADIIGGPVASLGYARVVDVSRLFMRRLLEPSPRRRTSRQ